MEAARWAGGVRWLLIGVVALMLVASSPRLVADDRVGAQAMPEVFRDVGQNQ